MLNFDISSSKSFAGAWKLKSCSSKNFLIILENHMEKKKVRVLTFIVKYIDYFYR
jgi:hypothetical protein